MIALALPEARAAAVDLLMCAGVGEAEATESADALLLADRWGIGSHGMQRLPWYLRRLSAGGVNPSAALRPVSDRGATVAFDGQHGLGHWQAWRAAQVAGERAAAHGVALVSVADSNHCGALGVFTLPLVERGLVGLVFSNGPAVMPPWGGSKPLLSTSPIAAGVPCGEEAAIIDLSLSTVARGKIFQHFTEGKRLPEGWALDADGSPTVDPEAALAGMLAPLGGAKGFALAFLVESLTGGLVGPNLSGDVPDMFDADRVNYPQGIAHLVIALEPAGIDGDGRGQQRLRRLGNRIEQAGGRIPGVHRVRNIAGDADEEVSVPLATAAELATWADEHGAYLPRSLTSAPLEADEDRPPGRRPGGLGDA